MATIKVSEVCLSCKKPLTTAELVYWRKYVKEEYTGESYTGPVLFKVPCKAKCWRQLRVTPHPLDNLTS